MATLPTTTLYGLDLAKSTFHIVGLDKRGNLTCSKKLQRSKLLQHFSNHPRTTIAMEACPGSHWMARKLTAMGHVAKIPPAQYVKPFAQKQKNDANDALAIAEASLRPAAIPIRTKSVDQQDLQVMHRIRDRLVNQRTRLICQARGIMLEYGIALRNGPGNFKKQLPEILEDGENSLSVTMRKLLSNLREELAFIEQQIDSITRRIKARADKDDVTRRLMSIPGIGEITATAMVAAVGDAKQFRKGRDLAAWLGLVPRQYSTGGKTSLSSITKQGNPYLRRMLIHGARTCVLHLNRKEHALGQWVDQLAQRMHHNKVTVALANKLARIAWVIMTHPGATYRRVDPNY